MSKTDPKPRKLDAKNTPGVERQLDRLDPGGAANGQVDQANACLQN
ncbi:MAG: hypothetical protein KBI32_06020 [Phycisphaerae bacterium]|nr:hypothetical protein [Phycisphaerae bacterium]